MRLREISSGIVVHVDDARGDEMIGAQWELADKPAADQNGADKPRANARRRNAKVE